MPKKIVKDESLVFSYLELRKAIGILGLALPFALSFGALVIFSTGLQTSISYYYWTGMRDVFVGTLFAIGFFLLSYRGYERADNIAGNLACAFAVGVALFPTAEQADPVGTAKTISQVHLVAAAAFFATLIYFCMVLFTKTNKKNPGPRKRMRNGIYRGCGYLMALCLVLAALFYVIPAVQALAKPYSPIYWLESIAILAFGVSWLVKGEAILKDL